MSSYSTILSSVKAAVHSVAPDAEVYLFGSRAIGTATEESDWDVLILTEQPVTSKLKNLVHYSLFPLSVEIGAFVNTLTVQRNEWLTNPSYYSPHRRPTIDPCMSTKGAAIKLILEKANAMFSEVSVLIDHQFYDTAVNRLYYSCYHATRALLLTKDLATKTHSGLVTLLNKRLP